MSEEWRDVPGWEGFYQVSSVGRVKSVERTIMRGQCPMHIRERIMAVYPRDSGHLVVSTLRKPSGESYRPTVHQLVAFAFIGDRRAEGLEIRHLNGDPSDNRVENLAWGTRAENVADMIDHGTHWQVVKTKCSRGHALVPGNLVNYKHRKGRECLSCQRAHSSNYRHKKKDGVGLDMQQLSDSYYQAIIREIAS